MVEAVNAIINAKRYTASTVVSSFYDQQRSPCDQNFLTVTHSFHSKATSIVVLHNEKIPESVWLYVFRIAFPASSEIS